MLAANPGVTRSWQDTQCRVMNGQPACKCMVHIQGLNRGWSHQCHIYRAPDGFRPREPREPRRRGDHTHWKGEEADPRPTPPPQHPPPPLSLAPALPSGLEQRMQEQSGPQVRGSRRRGRGRLRWGGGVAPEPWCSQDPGGEGEPVSGRER